MKAVMLINMGSPSSQKDMKFFLWKMFSDKAVIPVVYPLRKLIAFIISNGRYRNSWSKYELIGGSPLMKSMDKLKDELAWKLGNEYTVVTAYSYSNPIIKDQIEDLYAKGFREIIAIPVFPQYSISTSGSVMTDIQKASLQLPDLKIEINPRFYQDSNFISYWHMEIQAFITDNELINPLLLFSAHAIPQYHIEQGDTYVAEIEESAKLISESLGLDFQISFQSKIGRVKWVGPDTMDKLKDFKSRGIDNVLIVPISFINENLETLYDLDTEIVPFARKELGFKSIYRLPIPKVDGGLVETLKKICKEVDK